MSEPNWANPKSGYYALAFMRVQKYDNNVWRAWDVLNFPPIRPMHPTTYHSTLKEAKARCEKVVKASQ